jgi:malonyl CoA-acyl carrier protein transacylase
MKNSVEKLEHKFEDILVKVEQRNNQIKNGNVKETVLFQVQKTINSDLKQSRLQEIYAQDDETGY